MHTFIIESTSPFEIKGFFNTLPSENFRLLEIPGEDEEGMWKFMREEKSTTAFLILHEPSENVYVICMDNLASYEDYRFFATLCDAMALYLNKEHAWVTIDNLDKPISLFYNEEWVEECISDEIAYLKCILSQGYPYSLELSLGENITITNEALAQFGVSVKSATPRIYGYIQHALRRNLLPHGEPSELPDKEVEVPEHESIGRVKSWQTDGSETWESYSSDDVTMLLSIAKHVQGCDFAGTPHMVEGVVLNDIGTLFQEGVGVEKDAAEALRWFGKALECGDRLYAPTNMGDVWRKGGPNVEPDLKMAVAAYRESIDPYAHFRIGQSYEEGWEGAPDLKLAFEWYEKAASEGHHLALKRLAAKRKSLLYS
jgi:hypothetical protein